MIDITHWGGAQITFATLGLLQIGICMARHGRVQPNFDFRFDMLRISGLLLLMTWGGFFA